MVALEEASSELIEALRGLADEYGAFGVAEIAAQLTDTGALIMSLIRPRGDTLQQFSPNSPGEETIEDKLYGGTAWGDRFSAQWRDNHLALHINVEAPRSTEDGNPVILSPADVDLLQRLLVGHKV